MLENAAVFVSGRRVHKGVNVLFDDSDVIVQSRVDGTVLLTFPIVAVGKAGMAWDVEENGSTVRLVVQQGCGCGGMKPYQNDPEYTGPFVRR